MEKIVDNFDLIGNFMSFENPGDFYFVQALVRGKDGVTNNIEGGSINGNNRNRLVRFWTVKSKDELIKCKKDMINIANSVGARLYIHPTRRNFKDVANKFMSLAMETFVSENYEGLKNEYSMACGQSYDKKDKYYIVDVDDNEDGTQPDIDVILGILKKDVSAGINPLTKYLIVPTLHGRHIICKPFYIENFHMFCPNIDVLKNNPTLLYYNAVNK